MGRPPPKCGSVSGKCQGTQKGQCGDGGVGDETEAAAEEVNTDKMEREEVPMNAQETSCDIPEDQGKKVIVYST